MYLCTRKTNMVPVVQLVRASDCGSECRGFESHRAPLMGVLFYIKILHSDPQIHYDSVIIL